MIDETEPQQPSTQDTGAPYLGDAVRDLEDRFAPRIEEAKEQLNLVNIRVQGFIRQNPGTSLLCAVGLGYLIGKLASRK
jgi:hypothetical protein